MNLLINDAKTPTRTWNDDEYPLEPTYMRMPLNSLTENTRHGHYNKVALI